MGIESLEGEYASKAEGLRVLGISYVTEWRLNQRGIGPPRTYVGKKKFLFKVADLRAWLERQTSRASNIDRGQRKPIQPAKRSTRKKTG